MGRTSAVGTCPTWTARRVGEDEHVRRWSTAREVELDELAGDGLEELGLADPLRLRRRHLFAGEARCHSTALWQTPWSNPSVRLTVGTPAPSTRM
jgi:hypothetical protein